MREPIPVWLRRSGISETRKFYSEKVLRAALPLFEGVKVFRLMSPPDEDYALGDLIGYVTEPYWAEDGERRGIAAFFHPVQGFAGHPTSLCLDATANGRAAIRDGEAIMIVESILSVSAMVLSDDPADLPEIMRLPSREAASA